MPSTITGGDQPKGFPKPDGRDGKFPEGESLNEVAVRANRALEELIMPWVYSEDNYGKAEGEVHLVVVSHGIFISEV